MSISKKQSYFNSFGMKFFTFLLLILSSKRVKSLDVSNAEDIIKVINDAIIDVDEMEISGRTQDDIGHLDELFEDALTQVQEFVVTTDEKTEDLSNLLAYQLSEMAEKDSGIDLVSAILLDISFSINAFRNGMNQFHNTYKTELISRIDDNNQKSYKNLMRNLHDILIPHDDTTLRENFVTLLNEVTKMNNEDCGQTKSPRAAVYDIYSLIIGSEITAYATTSISYCALQIYQKKGQSRNIANAESEMIRRIYDYKRAFSQAVEELSPAIRTCDPLEYKKGMTFEELDKIRSISFREQIADMKRNKVVTGIKFVSKGSILQIQIQQGVLSRQGYVKSKTLSWLPLELIEADATKIDAENELVFYIKPRKGEKRRMVEKEEFGAFTNERNKINLDYLVAPKNHIITGVRFNYPRGDEEFGPIQLEIHVTRFNFISGKLMIDDDHPSKWITPDDMKGVISEYDRERTELVLADHWDYARFLGLTEPRSEPNSYVRLQTISLGEHDGQIVLPLIDLVAINGDPPFGLGGINLLYKASEPGGAGFISFTVEMVDPFDYFGLD